MKVFHFADLIRCEQPGCGAIGKLTGVMDELAACTDPAPGDLKFTDYPEGHHDADTWDVTYDLSAGNDIYAWMLSHTSPK